MIDYFFLRRDVVFTLVDKIKSCDVTVDDNGNF